MQSFCALVGSGSVDPGDGVRGPRSNDFIGCSIAASSNNEFTKKLVARDSGTVAALFRLDWREV